MVAGTPALQTRALRHVVSADARASALSRRPVCVGGPVSTIQADAGLQSRIRAPTRQHTPARSAPPIRKEDAALTRGSAVDNVFIERLWRSLKYECVYLSEFATGSEARSGISWWMDFYNERRPHSALDDRTPQEAYTDGEVRRTSHRG